jgi:hypothetical protein
MRDADIAMMSGPSLPATDVRTFWYSVSHGMMFVFTSTSSCEALKSATTCSSAGPSGPVKPFQKSSTIAPSAFVSSSAPPEP